LRFLQANGQHGGPREFTERLIHLSPDEHKERRMTIADHGERSNPAGGLWIAADLSPSQ
jgi:hypothetical protein